MEVKCFHFFQKTISKCQKSTIYDKKEERERQKDKRYIKRFKNNNKKIDKKKIRTFISVSS